MPIPSFPVEIIDNIITLLQPEADGHYDLSMLVSFRNVLCNCTLVCHTFLLISRRVLTRTIYIESPASLSLLLKAIQLQAPDGESRFPLNNVRKISFWGGWILRRSQPQLACNFPNLETLEFRHTYWRANLPNTLVLKSFQSVSSLVLWNCKFSGFRQVKELISVFHNISHLRIYGGYWITPSVVDPNAVITPHRDLPTLVDVKTWLWRDNSAVLHDFLSATPSAESITRYRTVYRGSAQSKRAFDHLLKTLGPTLQDLTLILFHRDDGKSVYFNIRKTFIQGLGNRTFGSAC